MPVRTTLLSCVLLQTPHTPCFTERCLASQMLCSPIAVSVAQVTSWPLEACAVAAECAIEGKTSVVAAESRRAAVPKPPLRTRIKGCGIHIQSSLASWLGAAVRLPQRALC